MKRGTVIASIATLGLVTFGFTAGAQSTVEGTPAEKAHYSASEIRQLRHDAHTPEQYNAIAGYYKERQAFYQQQAASEKEEWDRRSVNVSGPAAKYPRPVDSAKSLYEYYTNEAEHANEIASHYEKLGQSVEAGSNPANKPSEAR